MRGFLLMLTIATVFSACSHKTDTPTFGELSVDSIATDTAMQRNFETSYEFQKEIPAGDYRYEVKSTSYLKNGRTVSHFVVVAVGPNGSDTLYNQKQPASVFYAELKDTPGSGILLTKWKEGDSVQTTLFAIRSTPVAKTKAK
ncbi:MAG: hypothetical protein U0T73_05935 [Chitinophagales bacterium]